MSKTKIKQILNNMLEDFESKWCSHEERNNGIDKVAEKIIEEVPDREEEMTDMLEECKNQLEYLNGKFPTGTTSNILSRLQQLLHRILKMN